MPRVSREELLNKLESVRPGLAPRGDTIEQSASFIFTQGMVLTFNEEVACRAPCTLLGKFEGAVRGKPLLGILHKLEADEIKVVPTSAGVEIRCGRESAEVVADQDILLPVLDVKVPDDFAPLPEDFGHGLGLVCQCAATTPGEENLDMVHVHPKRLEATDDFQLIRYRARCPIDSPTNIRATAAKDAGRMAQEVADSDNWLHFKGAGGVVMSCSKYDGDFTDLRELFGGEGDPVRLPKRLLKYLDRATEFSDDSAAKMVMVTLGKVGGTEVWLEGYGAHGKYRGRGKLVGYSGQERCFFIYPKLLKEIIERYDDCLVTDERLRVESDKFTYAACLEPPPEEGGTGVEDADVAEVAERLEGMVE